LRVSAHSPPWEHLYVFDCPLIDITQLDGSLPAFATVDMRACPQAAVKAARLALAGVHVIAD